MGDNSGKQTVFIVKSVKEISMNTFSRSEFLKLGSLSLLGALVSDSVFANDGFFSAAAVKIDTDLMKKLLLNNDAKVKVLLQKGPLDSGVRLSNFRSLAGAIATMSAAVSHPGIAVL